MIFSTYEQPKWLEKVLWGFESQTHRDFEVVIVDDGSEKCRILNKAIAQSAGGCARPRRKNAAGIAANRAIRDEVAAKKLTRAVRGADQYLAAAAAPA